MDVEVDEAVACADPDCNGTAEPEVDGEHRYLACTTCGFEFGYKKAESTQLALDSSGACAIGVPESIRAAFSAPPPKKAPVALGLTIPVRRDS